MDLIDSGKAGRSAEQGEEHPPRHDRRRFLILAGFGVAGIAGAGAAATIAVRERAPQLSGAAPALSASSTTSVPAAFTVLTLRPGVGKGDLFFTDMSETAPRLVVADGSGREIWSGDGERSYADFRVQRYQRRPVLTWWESSSTGLAAYGDGRDVITDLDHNVIATVSAHRGVSPDEHEFLITDWDTALITAYVKTRVDLSEYGGPAKGHVMNGVFEEVDIASGRVLQHWESLDHVDLDESYAFVPEDPSKPYDYFHINSIKPTPDGHFLVSARHTWGIYKIERGTGRVLWRLGGKRSDFDLPQAATFAWQHDAQYDADTVLRIFDNASDGTVMANTRSRILCLDLNEPARSVGIQHVYTHPEELSAAAMGNAQRLPNGNVVVCWGTAKRITEFNRSGEVLFDAALPNFSYRVYRKVWR